MLGTQYTCSQHSNHVSDRLFLGLIMALVFKSVTSVAFVVLNLNILLIYSTGKC